MRGKTAEYGEIEEEVEALKKRRIIMKEAQIKMINRIENLTEQNKTKEGLIQELTTQLERTITMRTKTNFSFTKSTIQDDSSSFIANSSLLK